MSKNVPKVSFFFCRIRIAQSRRPLGAFVSPGESQISLLCSLHSCVFSRSFRVKKLSFGTFMLTKTERRLGFRSSRLGFWTYSTRPFERNHSQPVWCSLNRPHSAWLNGEIFSKIDFFYLWASFKVHPLILIKYRFPAIFIFVNFSPSLYAFDILENLDPESKFYIL